MKRLDTYSQHFLRSPRHVQELIGHTAIKKTDTVLEIGAGSGVITSALASRCKRVIAYELDPRMIKKLRDNLSGFDNVTVVQNDFLVANLPEPPYKVFANIPFHLSSPIVKKLTESDNAPDAVYLIVQKQFGRKLLIGSDSFTGLLGAQMCPYFAARIRKPLRRTDFTPNPAVDTVLIELKQRDIPLLSRTDAAAFREFVQKCFSLQKYFASLPLALLGLADKRPSELTSEQWVQLFPAKHKR